MLEYDEILDLKQGDTVNFREYTLGRREQKQLTLEVLSMEIEQVIPANSGLSIDLLEMWYGNGLSEQDYLVLSRSSCHRIVLRVVDPEHPERGVSFRVISLNQYFMSQGLQELEEAEPPEYLVNMNPNQMINPEIGTVKGFKDYDFGSALYRNNQN